ncbi:MAG: hypothetical protein ACI8UO_006168 [Verrucomicrobiales bacterium]|jgi:uncharacterized protein (TIGR03790 family)
MSLRLTIFLTTILAGLACAQENVRPSPYSDTTIIVCNRNSEGSEELAKYYARARAIPPEHIVTLDCPAKEEVTRQEFTEQIEQPLRTLMLSEGWWVPERDPETGEQAVRSSVHVIALMHGVPVKIKEDGEIKDDATEEERLQSTGASVDSELTILGQPAVIRAGPLRNPYFDQDQQFHEAGMPIVLVGRIDGPSIEGCRRMIDDAIRAEMTGLWGQAYIDLDDRHELGNTWLLGASDEYRKLGIPVTANNFAETFPTGYPMRDPILYFGWYERDVDGPFADPGFRFVPGAIACHLHSFSALKLRTSTEFWAGPLIERGAAAVLGNVYEPYLQYTHQFHIFAKRLAAGYTFVESASMSIEAISWMGVAIGDPLYQPFPTPGAKIDETHFEKDDAVPYKALRLAYERWGEGKPLAKIAEDELFFKMQLAVTKLPRPEFLEQLGLNALELQNYDSAKTEFQRAKDLYESRQDKLRMDLHIVELERRFDDRLAAFKALRAAIDEFKDIPEVVAAEVLLKALQTPRTSPTPSE